MQRLGVNSARLFITPVSDLRKFIKKLEWGFNLEGEKVNNSVKFHESIMKLRSENGRNQSYPWRNPVKWNSINQNIMKITRKIYGSDENSVKILNKIGVSLLAVLEVKCKQFDLSTMDNFKEEYWMERWELYKYSYALAIWARRKRIELIEFYNEPDLDLNSCLDSNEFLDIYQIRSLSIQQAYLDINQNEDKNNEKIEPKILASAFARKTYNGDLTKYLGELVINYNNYIFSNQQIQPLWSNMNAYSYHSYGKSGSQMADDIFYLQNSINNDLNRIYSFYKIPLIITEHNSHTSSDWNDIKSTPDNDFEASRLSSQIMNIILSNVKSHYVFKFSITPSFSSTRDVAMNGLHWGEIEQDPFDLADTTLSAESMRLLTTKLIKSKIYPIIDSNDSSIYRNYILVNSSSTLNDDLFYYLYAINDKDENVTLLINLNQLNNDINENTKLIVEEVNANYWNEVSNIIELNSSKQISINLNSYTTMRIAIQKGKQNINIINSTYSCTLRAGLNSNINECNNYLNLIGTSNTINHENTCVSLIKFNNINNNNNNNFKSGKTILKLNIQDVIINGPFSDMIIMILGIRNVPNDWIQSTISWTKLSDTTLNDPTTSTNNNNNSNILNRLDSGILINGIYKNFINWSSSTNISIVGHFIIKYDDITKDNNDKLKERMIDVSDYVNDMINSNLYDLTFILYRPFRHPSYKTGYGNLEADDLSNGTFVKFFGSYSQNPPTLLMFNSKEIINSSTTYYFKRDLISNIFTYLKNAFYFFFSII